MRILFISHYYHPEGNAPATRVYEMTRRFVEQGHDVGCGGARTVRGMVAHMSAPRVLVNALSMSDGGGRSYVANVLRELARDDRGFRFTFLVLPGQLEGLDTSGVEVAPLRMPRLPGRVAWRVVYEELLLPLRARRFDLLYCLADIAPMFGPTPTVVLLRNLNIYDRRWYDDARTRTLERLARLGLPHSRRVLFPSRAALEAIAERIPVPRARAVVVPHGVAPEAFATARQDLAAPQARYLFLPAAVERHKNVGVLVEGLARVEDSSLEVWIAGRSDADPDYRRELEARAAELGVDRRVRFLGPIGYPDVLRYYRGAVALVFPSFIETFGQPLLESMLAGTPVIASDIPTFREIGGDCALFFPPDDPEALARALGEMEGDWEATCRRVAHGRARAEGFSWKRSVDRLCAVFEEVLRED